MSIQINYKKISIKKSISNTILFVDEKFNISHLKKHISSSDYSFISDLLKTKNLEKNIVSFEISSKKRIVLISL